MATVYLCTDTKFDRLVAIKLLNPELAAAVGADRFHREIKIATGLTHPNILPAHDSGEANGSLYYVMPFVEGESLRDRLTRERQLSVQTAVSVTCEIASALHYAHTRGIIHRDIKPENILLESEHAVLADFGIARAVTSVADVEALTQTGMALGTPSYMSPEQAMGEKHLDGRSDQYSLACVTYEMLAGYPPFMANTMQALIAKHLGEPVPLITTVRPAVPDELEDVILRALEKVPADRFTTMQEFADALGSVITTTGTWARRTSNRTAQVRTTRSNRLVPAAARNRRRRILIVAAAAIVVAGTATGLWAWNQGRASAGAVSGLDKKKIAVLYFEDLSRDRSLAHAADGLTEGLIDQLALVRGLKVVSRRGVAPFRASALPRDSIGRALQAGSLIVGSIEPVRDRVHVEFRLVDGNSGVDVDRASFELPSNQLLVALDSLAKEAARLLRLRVGQEVRLQESRAGTSNVDAWTRVQLAERLQKQADSLFRTKDETKGLNLLSQADSTLAQAERADAAWPDPIVARGWIAYRHSELQKGAEAAPWLDTAVAHATHALKVAPNNSEALTLRGTANYRRWEQRIDPDPAALKALLQSARGDLESAISSDPTLARANIALSHLYYQTDDVPGALLAARRAYEEDPYLDQAEYALNRLFWGSLDLEQFGEARRWCMEGARRFTANHRFTQCQLWLMVTPGVPRPDVDQAWRLVGRLDTIAPTAQHDYMVAEARVLTAGAIARAGHLDSARRVLQRVREQATSDVDRNQDLLSREAYVRTLMGENDAAIDLLKRYVAAHPQHTFAQQARTSWWWRQLRAHPRWHEVEQPGH